MASTLLLDRSTWDLVATTEGNIAVASDPYSISQDVASACKLFRSELWYDTTLGVPYFPDILGAFPPLQYVKQQYVTAALTVPEVVAAVCFLNAVEDRIATGQVQSTTSAGVLVGSSF